MLDLKPKRPEKVRILAEKLGADQYHWAFNIQLRNFPFWNEAFDCAYKLGFKRGQASQSQKETKVSDKPTEEFSLTKGWFVTI